MFCISILDAIEVWSNQNWAQNLLLPFTKLEHSKLSIDISQWARFRQWLSFWKNWIFHSSSSTIWRKFCLFELSFSFLLFKIRELYWNSQDSATDSNYLYSGWSVVTYLLSDGNMSHTGNLFVRFVLWKIVLSDTLERFWVYLQISI